MTVSSALDRKSFTGDDATVAFATTPVVFFNETDLQVFLITTATGVSVQQSLTTHYSVTGGAGSTGTVTMVTAPASTQTLLIKRVLPITQAVDLVNNDASDAETMEDSLDKLTMIAQQTAAGSVSGGYPLRISDAETPTDALTVLPFARANKVLTFNASKELEVVDGTTGVGGSVALAAALAASGGSALVGTVQSGSGPIATTVSIKNRERLSLLDFCTDAKKAAIRAGTQTDVAAEFILAVAEASDSGRDLELPEGTPVISSATFTKGMRLWGHGMRTLLYVDSAVGASTDILTISPGSTADLDVTGYVFENFYMLPVSGTPGRHAVAINITTRSVSESRFRKLRLNALGGRGFVTLPHATPLTDGFFSSAIEDCVIANGVYLDKAGDSIRIQRNTLTGANAGVYADLVFVSASNKAHGLDIISNNISTSGGSVHIKSAWGAQITRNVFESSAGNANNALVDIDGTDATNRPKGVDVYKNFFGTPSGVDAVRVNFARMAQISMNSIAEPGGGGFSFKVTANAVDTQILYNPTSADSSISTQLSDAGTRTLFMRHGLTAGSTELNRDLYLIGPNGKYRGKDTAGTGIALLGISSNDNTVSVGAIDAPATNGHLLFYANGVNWGRYQPNGTFEANRSANGATANVKTATTLLSAVSGATVTAAALIPANAFIIGVTTRVTTGLGVSLGTTGYTVGDGTDADRWGAVTGTIAGTDTDNGDATANPTGWVLLGNNVVITAVGGNFDGTGAIRVTAFYLDTTAPAS